MTERDRDRDRDRERDIQTYRLTVTDDFSLIKFSNFLDLPTLVIGQGQFRKTNKPWKPREQIIIEIAVDS